MDPMNEANTPSYNLGEIWPFPVNNSTNGTSSFGNLGLNINANQEYDPMVLDHRSNNGAANLRKRRDEDDSGNAKALSSSSNGNTMNESDSKRIKTIGSNENHELKQEGEGNSGKVPAELLGKQPEPPKQDYIHVRARRGQATDSHSLAERARREKISERMKILQDLVPGCNKVIGKALVLDEIINYVQSLQRQVEFLSMKLEAVNSPVNPGIEGFPSKEYGQQAFDTSGMAFDSQASRDYGRNTSPEWHMQLGCGFERTT